MLSMLSLFIFPSQQSGLMDIQFCSIVFLTSWLILIPSFFMLDIVIFNLSCKQYNISDSTGAILVKWKVKDKVVLHQSVKCSVPSLIYIVLAPLHLWASAGSPILIASKNIKRIYWNKIFINRFTNLTAGPRSTSFCTGFFFPLIKCATGSDLCCSMWQLRQILIRLDRLLFRALWCWW